MRFDLSIIWSRKPYGGWRKIFPIFDTVFGLISLQIFGIIGLYTVSPFIGNTFGLGLIMTMVLAFFFFSLKYDLVKRNWKISNLEYGISKEGIHFNWGVFNKYTFFLPFEHISKVTHVGFDNSKYSKIYFHTIHDVLEFDFDFLTDDEVHLVCMENIPDGKKVFELIEYYRTGEFKGSKLERILLERNKSILPLIDLKPAC